MTRGQGALRRREDDKDGRRGHRPIHGGLDGRWGVVTTRRDAACTQAGVLSVEPGAERQRSSYSYSSYLSGFFAKYSRPSDLERPRQVVEKQGTSPKKILMEEETSAGIALGGVKAKDKRHEHGLWGV
ncbi:hypothetical protein F441_20829 [Phytophthora nicotianae CJ01A1]|uniref:Uncharacterized protein n=1 Tax=Phytophthora nicotianae CJ01A1 TaxID=1317063 RepID=W2VX97_PHYNI|nr:hypothetical protein F441_20829 [Phytophthora nicotianae CJ01A1]